MDYIKQREFREYDDIISIRINKRYYELLRKMNPKNVSKIVRLLIRVDIYDGIIETSEKDIKKMFLVFNEPEIKQIANYSFRNKKNKYLKIRLFKEEKQQIRQRSNGNISNYIELIVMEFINKIYEKYEEENSWRRLRWK